ncbi:hypothetical protein Tco_0874286 [Tanacetum coccineum]|uniref:Uncharacterized protein n=1 Tax=Tanacetum coccineum TaxID=301880 RepID=A0ABQ5BL65_9ASTR
MASDREGVTLGQDKEFEISSWRGARVDVRTYLLGGAIDSSEANGIIRDPKLELENSRFTFDLVPLCYESVDVVVGENWLLRHKAEMVCHEKVVKMPCVPKELVGFTPRRRIGFRMELVQGATPICEGSCRLTSLERQEVWNDCRSCKVRVGSNGNLLWEASVLLGRKKGCVMDTLKFTAMPFGLTNAPVVFIELMSRMIVKVTEGREDVRKFSNNVKAEHRGSYLDVEGIKWIIREVFVKLLLKSSGKLSIRVDVRTYLLGGAIDSSEANGIIRDPKLELESSRFTFDLVPLSYESVDVVVGENWLLRHKAEMVCHEKVVKMPWSCKVRVGSNGNLLWEASVLLGRKKGGVRVARKDDRGVTEGREDVREVFQQRGSGAKRKLSRCGRNQMGNEPILALPEGADDFVVYYDARSKDLEACLEKGEGDCLYVVTTEGSYEGLHG